MAQTNEKVMKLVEAQLKKNPDISVDELYEKARKASSDIGDLTLRQFNARYPLQVKRRMSASKRKPKRRRKTRKTSSSTADSAQRVKVRDTFLRFASDMAAAEQRKDLVEVLASVDQYVDQVMKATGGR